MLEAEHRKTSMKINRGVGGAPSGTPAIRTSNASRGRKVSKMAKKQNPNTTKHTSEAVKKPTTDKTSTGKDQTKTTKTQETDLQATIKATIKEINEDYAALEKRGDPIASKIGRQLLKISTKRQYKYDKGEDGKGRASMADFIKANFAFTPQYASMLMKSVKVKDTLALGDEVSLRSLRALNPYANNEEALKGIWALAKKSNPAPDANDIAKALEVWKTEYPEKSGATRKRTDKQILKQLERAMKGIAKLLAGLQNEEQRRKMSEKAMVVFGHVSDADEAPATKADLPSAAAEPETKEPATEDAAPDDTTLGPEDDAAKAGDTTDDAK